MARSGFRWFHTEFGGRYGKIIHPSLEKEDGRPLRAKLRKGSLLKWEIHLEGEWRSGGRSARGWILYGRERFRSRALEVAKVLLLNAWTNHAAPSRPNSPPPDPTFHLFGTKGVETQMIHDSMLDRLRGVFGPDLSKEKIVTVPEGVEEVTCPHVEEEIDVTHTSVKPIWKEIQVPLKEFADPPSFRAGRCTVCGTVYAVGR
ncbi:hypothetical protein C8P63_12164 [Melghirimyces profundicolus]|uniref:Uncharacterized protein n=1 Tax=Melghirimyces profundicolus TaxID=1242148 RepID=A0A2T6BGJ9_9BACL|nr:hypothetical protein C8P63_12164 [Melghirimyces profundicolus]